MNQVARQHALQDAFRRLFRRKIADRGLSELWWVPANENFFTPKIVPAGVVMEIGFVLDLEAPVCKQQELHRCGREAVIPDCFASCTVQRTAYVAPIAITTMARAPGADE